MLGIVALVLSAGIRASIVVRRAAHEPLFADIPRPESPHRRPGTLAVAGTFYEVMHFRFLWILLALTAVLAELPGLADAAESPKRALGGTP